MPSQSPVNPSAASHCDSGELTFSPFSGPAHVVAAIRTQAAQCMSAQKYLWFLRGISLAWEPIPLDFYTVPLPETIRRVGCSFCVPTRLMGPSAPQQPPAHDAYRGSGDFQTRSEGDWCSHLLTSDPTAPIAERWIWIPPHVWHQGVVPERTGSWCRFRRPLSASLSRTNRYRRQ